MELLPKLQLFLQRLVNNERISQIYQKHLFSCPSLPCWGKGAFFCSSDRNQIVERSEKRLNTSFRQLHYLLDGCRALMAYVLSWLHSVADRMTHSITERGWKRAAGRR